MSKKVLMTNGRSIVPSGSDALPDRGSRTGFNGNTYGADTSPTATNRKGGITGATQSYSPETRPGKNNQPISKI